MNIHILVKINSWRINLIVNIYICMWLLEAIYVHMINYDYIHEELMVYIYINISTRNTHCAERLARLYMHVFIQIAAI